jgi:uncharacterized protein with HEPN domain
MPVVDDISRLEHILDAARRAVQHAKGRKRYDLDKDDLLGLGIVHLLEIIGEAARGISEKMQEKYPEVEWRPMANMRNRLIHEYFDVNNDVVWETITRELPPLIVKIQRILKKETRS